MIGLRSRRATDVLPVQSIRDAAINLRGGSLRAVLECQTLAFGIKGEAEQRAVVAGWSSLLNSLTHPIQVAIRTRRLDPSALPAPPDQHRSLRDSYRRLVDSLADERRVVDRRFFRSLANPRMEGGSSSSACRGLPTACAASTSNRGG